MKLSFFRVNAYSIRINFIAAQSRLKGVLTNHSKRGWTLTMEPNEPVDLAVQMAITDFMVRLEQDRVALPTGESHIVALDSYIKVAMSICTASHPVNLWAEIFSEGEQ